LILGTLFVFYAIHSKPLAIFDIITVNNEVGHEKEGASWRHSVYYM